VNSLDRKVANALKADSKRDVKRGSLGPGQSLFEYLEDKVSLDEFPDCFPTVTREDAIVMLEHSKSGAEIYA
jgi:hypothetical protein